MSARSPQDAAATPDRGELIVACLCAEWCGVCRGWRADFAALAEALPAARLLWVDVEDQADALGDFDPETFPVLAVQRGAELLYCAALPPHAGSWRRVIESCAEGAAAAPDLGALPDLRQLA